MNNFFEGGFPNLILYDSEYNIKPQKRTSEIISIDEILELRKKQSESFLPINLKDNKKASKFSNLKFEEFLP